MNAIDFAPFIVKVGGGFLAGALIGYAVKQVMKIAVALVGLFVAALAYLEYQRIINVDWDKLQEVSQSTITWIVDTVSHIPNQIDATHTNFGIPLASSASCWD
jgi:uncharacterized membrane protein (Fun14 family)